ncbi:MAG: tRNA (adenosine(37)-N6)-threonylcarbamoyltransferase complex ATPase subunit type 1 TsaE [Nitrospirae bacterium]|nr:tRNA (adenosine(37)-N6)-threonylcarbamoyltransferase complex ATPase subunit type 1 TsaE [Nitrospirota bacterium]
MNKTRARRNRSTGTSKPIKLGWVSRSPEETRAYGERIGRLLTGGEWLALEGKLGAGKTQFIQGLARGLEITDRPVTSPTFVFVHEFRGRRPFAHVDLFRIEREEDLLDLGILEYLDSPWVVAIEWADKAGRFLPAERLTIRLTHLSETSRTIEIEAAGARAKKILDDLKRKN